MKKETKTAKKTNVIPLGDRVLIKPISPDELLNKNHAGIIIPDTISKEKPEQGRVVAVGPGKYEDGKLVPVRIKVGDMVVFSKYGFDEVKSGDEELFLVREENVLAIIK